MPWLYSSWSEEQNLNIFFIYLLFSIFNWRNLFSQSIIYGALFENVEERSVAQNIYTGLLSFSKVCDKLVNNDLLITLRNAIFFFLISSMLSGRLVRLWIFCQLQMLELPGISKIALDISKTLTGNLINCYFWVVWNLWTGFQSRFLFLIWGLCPNSTFSIKRN